MANRNHALDKKIVASAIAEFMDKGYQETSLRKIAEKAEVTVGALYTRYKTKDNLFCSLLEPLTTEIESAFQIVKNDYYADQPKDLVDHLNISMRKESDLILHLIFDRYDMAVMLLCRSNGSSLEHFFDEIVDKKVCESVCYFEKIQVKAMDKKLLRVLIATQFHSYYQIISNGYDADEARRCIEASMQYHFGGWTTLLNWMYAGTEE